MAYITIDLKYEVTCELSIDILVFDPGLSKDQGQAHFDCEYL